MPADGAGEASCPTCDPARLGLPEGRHIGQPAYHPSGAWLAMQVDVDPFQNVSSRNEIFLIEFAREEGE